MAIIELQCETCKQTFSRDSRRLSRYRRGILKHVYCSHKCQAKTTKRQQTVQCNGCGVSFQKTAAQIRKSTNNFCSKSCAASHNNAHRLQGTRRSKIEAYLEKRLLNRYSFPIDFNKKDAIGSELDIYIPHLRLAFEINGITHFEPIYGQKVLDRVQASDRTKRQRCEQEHIELHVLNISDAQYISEERARRCLDTICQLIDCPCLFKEAATLEI